MSNVTRISRLGVVNAYLVAEDDGITVVDTMLPASAKVITAAAAKLGAPIVRILLTHGHADHVGSLDALHALVPEAEVLISARDARLLRKDVSLDPDELQTKLRGGIPGVKTTPTRTVEAGETIGSLRAIATPGHTPGHLAFLDARDGTLLCGDVFATIGGVATSAKGTWKFPLPAAATWDKATELESARALVALNPARLASGHGKIVDSPVAAMQRAIDRGF